MYLLLWLVNKLCVYHCDLSIKQAVCVQLWLVDKLCMYYCALSISCVCPAATCQQAVCVLLWLVNKVCVYYCDLSTNCVLLWLVNKLCTAVACQQAVCVLLWLVNKLCTAVVCQQVVHVLLWLVNKLCMYCCVCHYTLSLLCVKEWAMTYTSYQAVTGPMLWESAVSKNGLWLTLPTNCTKNWWNLTSITVISPHTQIKVAYWFCC